MSVSLTRAVLGALLLVAAGSAPPARALDLEQVLADVAAANPSLMARQHEAAAARARARRAGAWDAPMLELAAVNVPAGGGFDRDPMTMRMVGVEQRVDLFGARGLARRAAQGDARAAEVVTDGARWERFADAWDAYAGAYYAAVRATDARAHRDVMNRMWAAARARYGSGRGRLDDLLRAEAERSRIAADAVTFDAEERSARARLAALRGRAPGEAPDALSPPPEWLAPDSATGWREAVAAHPRLRVLAEREAARRVAAGAARRRTWPELSLRASYGLRGTLADGTPQEDMWSAGAALDLPIGTGSRQGAEAAEEVAMAAAAASERQSEALELGAEIAAERARATAAQHVVALLGDTVLVAQQRALDAAWSAYESGTTDLTDVLESAHASYAGELDLARAHEELARALARLLALTARGELLGVRVPAGARERSQP